MEGGGGGRGAVFGGGEELGGGRFGGGERERGASGGGEVGNVFEKRRRIGVGRGRFVATHFSVCWSETGK